MVFFSQNRLKELFGVDWMISYLDSLQPLLHFFADYAVFILVAYLLILMMTNRSSFSLVPLAFLLISITIFREVTYFERPFVALSFQPLVEQDPSSSFPSMHAALSFALVACIHRFKPAVTPFTAVLATLIIASRVMSGLHYPIDVMFGALYGLVIVSFSSLFHSRFLVKTGRRKNRGRS